MVTAVAPVAAIAMTAFLVNVRHVFYGLSFPCTVCVAAQPGPTASSPSPTRRMP
ncbi:hypothetical protein [Kribbella caucasensis]|uniref:hypothetical protein n=1 Tax=Kribbella caucasensis TaxID=2512215 RepID=UPI00351AA82E